MDCKACGGKGILATTYQYGERATILHLIPASPFTETNYVKCGNCGELFVSRLSVFELAKTSAELDSLLGWRVPLISLTLTIGGLILCPVPGIGLVVNVLALLLSSSRPKHWTCTASTIGAVVAVVLTGLYIISFILWYMLNS